MSQAKCGELFPTLGATSATTLENSAVQPAVLVLLSSKAYTVTALKIIHAECVLHTFGQHSLCDPNYRPALSKLLAYSILSVDLDFHIVNVRTHGGWKPRRHRNADRLQA